MLLIDDFQEIPNYTYGNQQPYIENGNTDYRRYNSSPYTTAYPQKRRTWLWVLGWIFCFPIPATILINRKKDWNPALRIFLIIIVWMIYLGWMGGSSDSSSSSKRNSNEYPQYTSIVSEHEIVDSEKDKVKEITEISVKETTEITTSGIITFTTDTIVDAKNFHDRGNT